MAPTRVGAFRRFNETPKTLLVIFVVLSNRKSLQLFLKAL